MILHPLETERFLIRPLSQEDDYSTYLGWMRNPYKFPYIETASEDTTELELKKYVRDAAESSSALHCGIFLKHQGSHVGNIKFHDLDFVARSSFVGFLIGNREWQNRGVAKEVFEACSSHLYAKFNIRKFYLGVAEDHHQAIRAYMKMGFQKQREQSVRREKTILMICELG